MGFLTLVKFTHSLGCLMGSSFVLVLLGVCMEVVCYEFVEFVFSMLYYFIFSNLIFF